MMRTRNAQGATIRRTGTRLMVSVLLLAMLAWMIGLPALASGAGSGTGQFMIINGEPTGDMKPLLSDVSIEDQKGETVKDGKLFVGEKYKITLNFAEGGLNSNQFNWDADGKMTYQIPKNFKVTPHTDVILKDKDGIEIGKYSVTEDGLLMVELNDVGKENLNNSNNYTLSFEMDATALKTEGSDDEDVHFGDVGEDFKFVVTDQPQITVEKFSDYHSSTKILEYTVHTTVDHGPLYDAVVSDTLTPPETKGITLEMINGANGKPDIQVRVVRDGTPVELTEEDYELVPVEPDPTNPYAPQKFQIKLKESSAYNPLETGDELFVNYQYQAEFDQTAADRFFANVVNEATVSGNMPMTDPATGKEEKKPVEEKQGSHAQVYWDTDGNGVVSKDQHYSEATGLLHYTLYAAVAPGKDYTPFYINDRATVEYNGHTWTVQGFDKAHCKNLKVYAQDVDVDDWNDTDENGIPQPTGEPKELTGYDFQAYLEAYGKPGHYSAESMDNYIYWMYTDDKTSAGDLYIFFGKDEGHEYGHWDYEQGRLITVEYDLDVSNGLTLYRENDDGTIETVTLSREEVLLAGITNKVTLQYGPFFPSYTVFFSNGEKLNKSGKLDKVNNTIDYTVSLDLKDSTVWEYLHDVNAQGIPAMFFDDYDDGWSYVDGTLRAKVYDRSGGIVEYSYNYTRVDAEGKIAKDEPDNFSAGKIEAYLHQFYMQADWGIGLLPYYFASSTSNLDRVEFTYTLKASDEWLKAHAYGENDTNIHNKAEIKDSTTTHWNAEANVLYFPNRLSKTAQQEGTSNLITFTLDINSVGADLDEKKDYLIVTDESTGIQIKPDSIKVTDKDGKLLDGIGDTTLDAALTSDQWGLLPTEDEHQYRLKIPDGKALRITYDALVTEMGDSVEVSNKASIDGVERSDSSYEGALKVDNIHGTGGGDVYHLTIVKVDSENHSKKLPNAKFALYAVRPEDPTANAEKYKDYVDEITIGEKTYRCQLMQDLTTGPDGSVSVESRNLEPGRYYILEELEAPEGYALLEEPVLFYFGLKQDGIDPTVEIAPPEGMLTVDDPPVQFRLPESGGSGTALYVALGVVLVVGSVALLIAKKRLHRAG